MEISEKALKFIQEHAKADTNALRLKYSGKSEQMDFPLDFALLQIEGRRKAQRKIPTFLKNALFVFPDTLAAEQATNEVVARYHASLVNAGSSLLDLTAGLGIDDLNFAMKGIRVTACEIDTNRAEALRYNSEVLGLADHITVINEDSMVFAESTKERYDTVFTDPARRSSTGKRLHALSDCQPDILSGMTRLMKLTDRLLIKCSPLLDLTLIRNTVADLHCIHIVCFKGECKEVLIEILKDSEFSGISVVDLDLNGTLSEFECHLSPTDFKTQLAERSSPSDFRYLYEPNAGVMKTGAWGVLSNRFNALLKADANTHLFLSDTLFPDFPGRILITGDILDKKALKELKGSKFNVVARNHPMTAPEVVKKLSITSGGDRYLYAFRYKGKPFFMNAYPVDTHEKRISAMRRKLKNDTV